MNAIPITPRTSPLTLNCEAAPGKGTIVGEEVGFEGVAVAVELLFPVTFKFKQICLTRFPKAMYLLSKSLPQFSSDFIEYGSGRDDDALSKSALVQVEEFCKQGTMMD